jgi:hypothetical protein
MLDFYNAKSWIMKWTKMPVEAGVSESGVHFPPDSLPFVFELDYLQRKCRFKGMNDKLQIKLELHFFFFNFLSIV